MATGHLALWGHEVRAQVGTRDPSGGAGATAEVCLEAGHGALSGVAGSRHRVVVELAFGREEHALPPLGAEPAEVQVGVSEHEELLLATPREVQAPGPRRAADSKDGRLDGVDVLVDDGSVEVLFAVLHSPGCV